MRKGVTGIKYQEAASALCVFGNGSLRVAWGQGGVGGVDRSSVGAKALKGADLKPGFGPDRAASRTRPLPMVVGGSAAPALGPKEKTHLFT